MATTAKEHPMLMASQFIGPTMDGRKTQTRRPVTRGSCAIDKWLWDRLEWDDSKVPTGGMTTFADNGYLHVATRPHPDELPKHLTDPGYWTRNRVYPKWEVGDRIWIREAFDWFAGKTIHLAGDKTTSRRFDQVLYRADGGNPMSCGCGCS